MEELKIIELTEEELKELKVFDYDKEEKKNNDKEGKENGKTE